MNRDLKNLIEILNAWDTLRYSDLECGDIVCFTDSNGGFWDLTIWNEPKAPCSCIATTVSNQFRQFWYCPKHPDVGFLVNSYREGKFVWFSGRLKKEV